MKIFRALFFILLCAIAPNLNAEDSCDCLPQSLEQCDVSELKLQNQESVVAIRILDAWHYEWIAEIAFTREGAEMNYTRPKKGVKYPDKESEYFKGSFPKDLALKLRESLMEDVSTAVEENVNSGGLDGYTLYVYVRDEGGGWGAGQEWAPDETQPRLFALSEIWWELEVYGEFLADENYKPSHFPGIKTKEDVLKRLEYLANKLDKTPYIECPHSKDGAD